MVTNNDVRLVFVPFHISVDRPCDAKQFGYVINLVTAEESCFAVLFEVKQSVRTCDYTVDGEKQVQCDRLN